LRAQENIKNIEKLQPELFLVAGDLSYKKTPDCWFNMTKSLDSKTKIAIGNHDAYEEEGAKGESLKQLLLDHYNLNKSYYSFDYQNVHVLVMDTQLELSVDTLESTAIIDETTTTTDSTTEGTQESKKKDKKDKKDKNNDEPLYERFPLVDLGDLLEQKSIDIEIPQLDKFMESNAKVPAIDVDEDQYMFVLDDLEKASKNKNIDWIIVMFHKPMYSSISKQFEEYIIRDKYQSIFDKYGIDLVIQGHNHIYSRTLPLSFNQANITRPIVDQNSTTSNNNNIFINPNGIIFLVVGVGGDELHRITEEQYYIVNQYNKGFGFVDLNIDGKKLDGSFYDINLNCKIEITEKKKREVIDLGSCLPSSTSNNNLKVIDQFTIQKFN
jgi:3',5'-cyclic AMP phosphodiesterase CpdA